MTIAPTPPSWFARYRTSPPDQPARAALLNEADRYGHTEHVHALLDAHAAEVLAVENRPDEAALHALAADIHAREAAFFATRLSVYALEAAVERLTAENAKLHAALTEKGQPR